MYMYTTRRNKTIEHCLCLFVVFVWFLRPGWFILWSNKITEHCFVCLLLYFFYFFLIPGRPLWSVPVTPTLRHGKKWMWPSPAERRVYTLGSSHLEESKVETQAGKAVKSVMGTAARRDGFVGTAPVKQLLTESEKEKRPQLAWTRSFKTRHKNVQLHNCMCYRHAKFQRSR